MNDNQLDPEFDDLSNRELLKIMLDEMACVHRELSEDIRSLDRKLSSRIDKLEIRIDTLEFKVDDMGRKLDGLNVKVDQNHLTFMHHIDDYDKRIMKLESAA